MQNYKGVIIDEHNAKVYYKPGKENHVADGLSRQQVNNISEENDSDNATIHSEQSLTYTIARINNPVISYRNQLIIEEAEQCSSRILIVFGKKSETHYSILKRRVFVKKSQRGNKP